MGLRRTVGGKLLAPLVAAGTSAAASYVVKKAPRFLEETVLPRLRGAEKLPEKAKSVASGGGDLAEQLTERARGTGSRSRSGISKGELSERSEARARRRAERRKAAR